MKAAVNTQYGPPEVVHVTEVDTPHPGEREVLVQVHVATVNRTDCGLRAAHPPFARLITGLTRPRVTILGGEFAGVVTEVGAGVTSFVVGEPVFGYADDRPGAHAEYLVMPEDGPIARIPPGVTMETAAASTEASHYALTNIAAGKVGPGYRVLVYGATGAIGSAAVQLLKIKGAYVTAVCDTDHVELVRELGADRVIDYQTEDFTAEGPIYDVVFDAVGKSSFGQCRHLLTPKGIYLSTDLGPHGQNPFLALVTPVLGGRRATMPLPSERTQQDMEALGTVLASGRFRPVIDRSYPLDRIVEAYQYVESERKVGNVLITVT